MAKQFYAQLAAVGLGLSTLAAQPAPPPELPEARVTLPYSELKALWQAAHPEEPEKRQPPVEAALLSARYQIVLKGDQAFGVVEYETESFTDEWTTIPLLGAQTQIDEVEPADIQLIMREGHYALVTNRPGKQKLRLKFAVRLSGTTDGAHFRLETSPAAINTLGVAGLGEKQTLRIAEATQLSAEKGRVAFRLPALEQLNFDIVPEKAPTAPVPSRWKIGTQALVEFADGRLNYIARLAANSDQGSGLTMELLFPPAAEIVKIEGADLSDWQVTVAENQARRVHLRWRTADILRRELEIEYNLPQSLSAAEWSLGGPRLVEGENDPPLFVVVPEEGLELTASDTAAPRQLSAWLRENVDGKNFVVCLGEASLAAKWLPLIETAEAIVETAAARTRIVADGALLTEVDYSIRHERALRWRVELPEGCELLTATVDRQPARPIDRGNRVLEFSVPSGNAVAAVSLSFTAKKPPFKPVSGQIAVELPQTDLLIHRIDWELRIPAAYEVGAFEGNVESGPSGKPDETSRPIQLHKELCKNERPRAEFFYQKPEPNK
jgi:hypothetical protein